MNDPQFIDDALRSVREPEALLSKLRPESLFADAEIDRLLANVPVPSSLAASIRASVRDQPTRSRDGVIDLSRFTAATTAPLPAGGPCGRLARPREGFASLTRDIASVFAALGLVLVLAIAGIEFSRRLEGPLQRGRAITRLDFTEPADAAAGDWPMRLDVPDGAWPTPERSPVDARTPSDELHPGVDAGSIADTEPSGDGGEASRATGPSETRVVRGAPLPPATHPGLLGQPAMITVDIPGVMRRSVPRVRGYDLAFEMTTGEQPFVDPAVDPGLATDRPPLSLRTDGFEALTSPRAGDRRTIRAEEVLAAVSPPPGARVKPGAIGLEIHEVRGLRSVGNTGSVLVEVAALAGPAARPEGPVEATLVVDQAAAGDPAVWRRICRAMADLATHLSPHDRMTVVLCGPRPRVVLEGVGSQELAALAADLEWQPASSSSDVEGGLELARPGSRVVVVAHASSLDAAGQTVRKARSAWHTALSLVGGDALTCNPAGGVRFVSIDPAAPAPIEPDEPTFGRTSPEGLAIRRELVRQVFGHDTLVARDCRIDVRFDPRRVARYRLIGHRQSAVESLADSKPRSIELHAGELVRAVYEVIPRSPDVGPGMASAVVSWCSPEGGRHRLETGPNRSSPDVGDGLPSPHGCELLLAAGLGELAAGSAHVGRRPAIATALDEIISRWRARGDVTAAGDALARSHERRERSNRKGG